MDTKEKRERFGRYLILDHLVDGGMAKICRARFLGEQADKVVAIKMVQSKFSADEQFKTMFMDEIKVTFGLIHPNIIQTYDYGYHKEQLFVAMEYCDGRNLKEYLRKMNDGTFPIEIATYIIAQSCLGLSYAHNFTDPLTGKKSHIIHRDISPHNIMLTFDGGVKVIDFGIAKSKTNSDATVAGTIKGKISYLAPEYIEGMEIDGRYDQFALGVTLWELLCGKKLFEDLSNDMGVLKKIRECKVPVPSSVNKNIPNELDEILLKVLSKDRENRYKDLDELNRVLMKLLYTKFPDFNVKDISNFASQLFKEEIKVDKAKMFSFGTIDLKPYLLDLKKELSGASKETKEAMHAPNSNFEFDFDEIDDDFQEMETEVKVSKKDISHVEFKTPSKPNIPVTNTKIPAPKKKGEPEVIIRNIGPVFRETSEFDDPSENSTKKIALLASIVLAGVIYVGYTYMKNVQIKKNEEEQKRVIAQKEIEEVAVEPPLDLNLFKSSIILSNFDKQKMQAFINGRQMDVDLLSTIKAPFGVDFTLRIQTERKKHFIQNLKIEDDKPVEINITDTDPATYGYLNTIGKCAKGELRYEVFDEKRLSRIPLVKNSTIGLNLNLDEKNQVVPTHFQLFFKPTGSNIEKPIEVTLEREDQFINLCKILGK